MLLSFKKKRRLDAMQRAQPPSPREAGLADSGLWVGSLRPFPERQPLERLCKCETPPYGTAFRFASVRNLAPRFQRTQNRRSVNRAGEFLTSVGIVKNSTPKQRKLGVF